MNTPCQRIFRFIPFPSLLLEFENDQWVIKDVSKSFYVKEDLPLTGLLDQELSELCKSGFYRSASYWRALREALKKTDPASLSESRIIQEDTKGEATRHWKMEHQALFSEEGRFLNQVIHSAVECTKEVLEEKNKEEIHYKLEKTVAQRKAFIDSNPDGMYSFNLEGDFLSTNEGFAKILEIPRTTVIKRNFRHFCPDYENARVEKEVEKVFRGSSVQFKTDYILPGDKKKILSIWLMPMVYDNKIQGAHGIAKDVTEVEKVRRAIQEKEEEVQKNNLRFKALVEGSSDFFGIVDCDGIYQYVSDSTTAILGFHKETFVGKNAFDDIHPSDKDRVYSDFARIMDEKRVKIPAFRFADAKGNWRWMETTVTNMLDNPDIEGLVINTRDVTEVVTKDQEISELFDRYALAAAATGDLIYDWDILQNTFKRFFKGKERQLGYTQEEMESRSFWREHIHPEEIRELKRTLKNSLADPSKTEIRSQYRFERKDGTYAHLIDRGMILRDQNGEAKRLIGAISDISDIVMNRQALRLANKRFSYAMKATQEMIWDWDIQEQVIQRGRSFEKLLGYDPGSRSYEEDFWFSKIAYKDQDRVRTSLDSALKDPKVDHWKQEYRFFKHTGEKAFIVDRAYILRDTSGMAIRMVGAALDVTESRQMLKEIKKQNKILKEVAWEQAHVVRAPLARLKGLLNLLIEEEDNEGLNKGDLMNWIMESADELDEVIHNIIKRTERI